MINKFNYLILRERFLIQIRSFSHFDVMGKIKVLRIIDMDKIINCSLKKRITLFVKRSDFLKF